MVRHQSLIGGRSTGRRRGAPGGADADLFDVFNPNVTFPLFTGEWDLFKKCWETANSTDSTAASRKRMTTRRRGIHDVRAPAVEIVKRDVNVTDILSTIAEGITQALACPISGFQNLTEILEQTISSAR